MSGEPCVDFGEALASAAAPQAVAGLLGFGARTRHVAVGGRECTCEGEVRGELALLHAPVHLVDGHRALDELERSLGVAALELDGAEILQAVRDLRMGRAQ